uniref:NR LBD domain-containing protein n=1 Tax=Panagrellus redivivus TaxID=6233 RepID=A0A7E4VPZ5_PANRE
MVFRLQILRWFTCLKIWYDGLISPIWSTVLSVDEIIDRNRLIYAADTLILHCESIESYEKVIPFLVGPYRRLIINGNITWKQAERLITCAANVKQVRINARIHFEPGEHSLFVELVMLFCRGPLYR